MSEHKKNSASVYLPNNTMEIINALHHDTHTKNNPRFIEKMVSLQKTLIDIAKQEGVEPTEFFKAMEWILEAEPSGIRESFQKYCNSLD